MKKFCTIVLGLLTLSSCSYVTYTTHFMENNYRLKHTSSTLDPEGSVISNQRYQDDYLTTELLKVTNECIYLTLTNNSTSTIRLLWDEAAFTDFNGYSHRINHDNSAINKKYSVGRSITRTDKHFALSTHSGNSTVVDKNRVQIPTVIPAGARINTVIIPADNAPIVRFNFGKLKLGRTTIPEDDTQEENQKQEELIELTFNTYQARTAETAIKLLLPIEVEGTKIEYTATLVDEFQMYTEGKSENVVAPWTLLISLLGLGVMVSLL